MPLNSKAIAFLSLVLGTRAAPAIVDTSYNDGIHLAIGPTCGLPSANGSVVDVNARLYALSAYKTIVSFGDSFTSNGKFDGSEPDPPVPVGTSPRVSIVISALDVNNLALQYGGRFANGYGKYGVVHLERTISTAFTQSYLRCSHPR